MTDSNRAEAQAELKQVIADSFAAKTLWTTDWAGVQLQKLVPAVILQTVPLIESSLLPKPLNINLKRKMSASIPSS